MLYAALLQRMLLVSILHMLIRSDEWASTRICLMLFLCAFVPSLITRVDRIKGLFDVTNLLFAMCLIGSQCNNNSRPL